MIHQECGKNQRKDRSDLVFKNSRILLCLHGWLNVIRVCLGAESDGTADWQRFNYFPDWHSLPWRGCLWLLCSLCQGELCQILQMWKRTLKTHVLLPTVCVCVFAETGYSNKKDYSWAIFQRLKYDQRQKLPQHLTAASEPISNARAFVKQLYDLCPSHTPDHLAQFFGILV